MRHEERLNVDRGPQPSAAFCVPPNPILQALRLHAELNLHKLRSCRNIAGMERALEPYAAPTDTVSGLPAIGVGGQLVLPGTVTFRPTAYRYTTLVERAKHLVLLAGQVEAAMLAALEKLDAEAYSALKARQDLGLHAVQLLPPARVGHADAQRGRLERDDLRPPGEVRAHRPIMISNVVLHSLPVGYRFDLRRRVRIAAPALRALDMDALASS